jgi:hypothetical protein
MKKLSLKNACRAHQKTERNIMTVCKKCNTDKPLTEFSPNKGSKNGHLSWCKVCRSKFVVSRAKALKAATHAEKIGAFMLLAELEPLIAEQNLPSDIIERIKTALDDFYGIEVRPNVRGTS